MAPRASLNSSTPTTSSKFHLWLIVWLTCWFIEDAASNLDPESVPPWLAWDQTMRESDYNCDILDFASSSWPDLDHFTPYSDHHEHPLLLQPAKRLRESNEPEEAEAPKRKMFRSFTYDRSLPFVTYDAQRPSELEEAVIFDAIKSLRKTDGSMFIDDAQGEYRMLKIEQEKIREFLSMAVHRGQNTAGDYVIGNIRPSEVSVEVFTKFQRDRRRESLREFYSRAVQPGKFKTQYINRVIPDFEDFIKESRSRITSKYSGKQEIYLLNELHQVLNTLPLYLFHADLINVLIPVSAEENSTLRSQRQVAGKQFFQDVFGHIETYDGTLKKGGLAGQDLSRQSEHPSFVWNIVGHWIRSSRSSLASRVLFGPEKGQQNLLLTFKQLFNEILTCFVEQLPQEAH
ncbi:hypothetical protein PGT21_004778 [Puccinia graminis f. sp. tritici]|uniref:Uncharacterized protein n=1 Tax=Puccinia graminis f. sp. tritici TaxID=56615 RepID=A0A5B0S4R9_PUCGR|nr:hypothetical protein PGT21_004778 [Puccinia graminis f. sp. tritici]KAA1084867.1 hypothetical protein PGTUg99_003284 [Puccinia graminis f. sp. tritici]KAA1132827.1 hypothetical protein PGTUg99_001941 [Puccinia graminis f. sp. tritici]KAA1135576.1 hypothetical protein PGTUg99_022273 [Puccinia graminis f. sp. tritici]